MNPKTLLSSQDIIDQLPFNLFWKNRDGLFLGANQSLLNLTGHKEHQLIGKRTSHILISHIAEALEAVDMHVIQSGQVFRDIEQGTDKYGNAATYFSIKQPLIQHSKIIGMIGCAIDITSSRTIQDPQQANEMLSAIFKTILPPDL